MKKSSHIVSGIEQTLNENAYKEEKHEMRQVNVRISSATFDLLTEVSERLELSPSGAAANLLGSAIAEACEFFEIDWRNHPSVVAEVERLYPGFTFVGDSKKSSKGAAEQ